MCFCIHVLLQFQSVLIFMSAQIKNHWTHTPRWFAYIFKYAFLNWLPFVFVSALATMISCTTSPYITYSQFLILTMIRNLLLWPPLFGYVLNENIQMDQNDLITDFVVEKIDQGQVAHDPNIMKERRSKREKS